MTIAHVSPLLCYSEKTDNKKTQTEERVEEARKTVKIHNYLTGTWFCVTFLYLAKYAESHLKDTILRLGAHECK